LERHSLGKFGKDNHRSKPVLKYSLYNILVDEYVSITDASMKNKASISGIYLCCVGKQKTSGKFKWKFK